MMGPNTPEGLLHIQLARPVHIVTVGWRAGGCNFKPILSVSALRHPADGVRISINAGPDVGDDCPAAIVPYAMKTVFDRDLGSFEIIGGPWTYLVAEP